MFHRGKVISQIFKHPNFIQKSLDKLSEYCKKWQLSVTVKKTKAIIFQQRNIPYNKSDFYLNGYKLEKLLKYKYLGNLIEASGKFHSTHIELSKRVVRLCFPCLNT